MNRESHINVRQAYPGELMGETVGRTRSLPHDKVQNRIISRAGSGGLRAHMQSNENVVTQRMISADAAVRMLTSAKAHASQLEKSFSIAIVDAAGVLVAFHRMDGASLGSVQVSIDKAYSAAAFGRGTHEWPAVFEKDAALRLGAPSGLDRLVPFGGGLPIVIDGARVGGIGVSGAHYTEDQKVAQAGLDSL